MTTYAWPAVSPHLSTWVISSNTAILVSPFTGAVQTINRGGERWEAELRFLSSQGDNKAVLKAFLSKLNGQEHRFTIHDHSQIQRGAFGGTPLVDGAPQGGNTLAIKGAAFSVTNWIRAGDHFSVNGELKMATEDANSDGAGLVTLTFTPKIRVSPSNNGPVTTVNPTGTFLLADNRSSWSNRRGDFSDFVVRMIEDITV